MKIYLTLILMLASTLAFGAKKLPNIVLYLFDDMGFGSINCNGAPTDLVKTPNIDSLASSGMRFTNAHTTSSVCTPTRYALMTGRYAWRGSLQIGVINNAPILIEEDLMTIPMMLKKMGYQTACVGKWHLGFTNEENHNVDFRKNMRPGPNERGFDYYFCESKNFGHDDGVWLEQGKIWGLRSNDTLDLGRCYYGSPYKGYDAPMPVLDEANEFSTNKALEWLDSIDKDKPFFLYFSSLLVHEPIIPSKKNKGKSGCGDYGDFIMDGDDSVGMIIDYLKKNNLYENTLFIMTSDNGANVVNPHYNREDKIWAEPRFDHWRAMGFEQGHPLVNALQDANRAGLVQNGIYRDGKCDIYDGGTRVPFIVRWPNNIPVGVSNEAFSLVDVMSTIADAVGYKLERNEMCAPDSINVMDIWKNKKFHRANIITHSASGTFAIRDKDVKYIEANKNPPTANVPNSEKVSHLYDLNEDISEKENLLKEEEDLVKEFQSRLDKIRSDKMTK